MNYIDTKQTRKAALKAERKDLTAYEVWQLVEDDVREIGLAGVAGAIGALISVAALVVFVMFFAVIVGGI